MRQHSRLINLLGVNQIRIGVNKTDCGTVAYRQSRYDEIANEMRSTLVNVGWKEELTEKNPPVMPISGWMGDDLLKKSDNMAWWKGQDGECGKETTRVDTIYDVLDKLCCAPERPICAPRRIPISGVYKSKGVGDVLAGYVEQGVVKPGEEVVYLVLLSTHMASNPCTGKVFTVEMHHQRVELANPGDNGGLNIKGLDKNNNTAACKQSRYDEIVNEMESMLVKVGWKKEFVEKNPPVMSISGWMGDNSLKRPDNMAWWKEQDVESGKETIHVDTLYDVLDKLCRAPEWPISTPMRMPISGIYRIKGVGDVLAGRVEQGAVKPGEEVVLLPMHMAANPCTGKVFTVEMHHQRVELAKPGDSVGMNIKGLDKNNMPRSGDVMDYKGDTTLGQTREFDVPIQVLDTLNEIKVDCSPIGSVRCGRLACRTFKLS